MIIIDKKDVKANNPADNIKKLDGSHYGVICNVTQKNSNLFICSVYIPEIYGVYTEAQNYPFVEVPFRVDSDDSGHTPQIGELCKVMFEDGSNNTCRFVYYVPIDEQTREANEDYLKRGILNLDVLEPEADEEDIKKFMSLLDLAYYVTTGHWKDEIDINDFVPCVLGAKLSGDYKVSGGKNYFCKALGLPFVSYLTTDHYSIGVPIISSKYYNVVRMLTGLTESDINDKVSEFYTNSIYDYQDSNFLSLYEIYRRNYDKNIANLDEIMQKITISTIGYVNPHFTKLLYPGINIPPSIDGPLTTGNNGTTDNFTFAESVWDMYDNNSKYNKPFSQLLHSYQVQYEKQWFGVVNTTWNSIFNGLNKQTDNTKLKHTIYLCLTICPWLAYPMGGYDESVDLQEDLQTSLKLNNTTNFRTYSTYLNNHDEFVEVRDKLQNLVKQNSDPISTVKEFRNIAYEVFGDGMLDIHNVGASSSIVNTWSYYEMDAKFDRLKDQLPDYIEALESGNIKTETGELN